MKQQAIISVICGLFLNPLPSVQSLECGQNSVGIDWTSSTVTESGSGSSSASLSWQSGYDTNECEQDVCSAGNYDIDLTVTVNNLWGIDWLDLSSDLSFSLDTAFCGDANLCNIMAGGENSCNAVQFDFQQWFPTSCDADSDYDATTFDYNITYKYGCCNTTLCNEDYDYSICTYNTDFGNYVNGLYDCWNGVRKDLMKYLICDNETGIDVYWFNGHCRDEGDWSYDDDEYNCTYIHQCTDEFSTILTNFGECACDAATSNGYSGAAIAEIMETQWSAYCPSLNLTCAPEDGSLELFITRWVLYWTFNFDSEVIEDYIEQIEEAIAEAGNVDSELVIVYSYESNSNDGSGTTITVTIDAETESDSDAIKENLNEFGDSYVFKKTGVNVTNGTAEVEETTEDFYSSNSTVTEDAGMGLHDMSLSSIVVSGVMVVFAIGLQ